MRRPTVLTASEHAEQVAVFDFWNRAWKTLGARDVRQLYSTPNGGMRNVIVAVKLKAEGVRAGKPDISLDIARGGFFGLKIELKAAGGKLKAHQAEELALLRLEGYNSLCCVGATEAINAIKAYMRQPKTADMLRDYRHPD